MKRRHRMDCARIALGLVVTVLLPVPGTAQDDYRHLDEGRPLRVEDAYPIKFHEWEWELGTGVTGLEGGALSGQSVLELKTGIFRNAQLGVEAHGALERVAGISETGIEELQLHFLYNLNQEGSRTPAIAARVDAQAPGWGEVARVDWGARIKAMATRTFGRSRVHLNGAYRWQSESDGDGLWEAGAAWDRALGLTSRMVGGDVFVEFPKGGPARIWVDLGGRMQLTKQLVLDAGVFSRIDEWNEGVPNLGFTVGVSRGFGLRSLMPVGPYPDPRLR